jgi:uncharacterized coiled-coil protein SlyX
VRSRKAKLNADRISELERKSGQQTMEIDFFKKSVAAFQKTSSASRRQTADSMSKFKRRAKRGQS